MGEKPKAIFAKEIPWKIGSANLSKTECKTKFQFWNCFSAGPHGSAPAPVQTPAGNRVWPGRSLSGGGRLDKLWHHVQAFPPRFSLIKHFNLGLLCYFGPSSLNRRSLLVKSLLQQSPWWCSKLRLPWRTGCASEPQCDVPRKFHSAEGNPFVQRSMP